jgi:hypothetical protein
MIGGRLVENVWIVQAVRFDGVGVIENVCADLPRALAMAAQRSMDPAVLCTSVIGCVLDQSEGRTSVAHYVDGRGQEPRASRCTFPEQRPGRTS